MISISLLGNICVFGSFASSLFGIYFALFGIWNQRESWIRRAWWFGYLNFFLMTLASTAMMYALLTNDFSVQYVAQVGAIETPRLYSALSLWSSLEGSILLWGWILSGYTAACLYRFRNEFKNIMPWVAVTLLCIGVFFYLVLAFPANPFKPMFPVPTNGPGPNALLQNHWLMAVHPPMLYLGYVGMSVPFAFAIASIIVGDLTNTWMEITRRWTLFAWMFLSTAIVFGGWWSYAVLGWGGYWAWDPVENASFMPWLTGTAFLHSIMVQKKREMLKVWNLILIIATFFLTLLGTFLTRSGVLDSVHSFTESGIGHWFLIFMGITLAIATALVIWKAPRLKSPGNLDHPFCRETLLLLANLLLVIFCVVVLLGTLYPLIAEALRGIKVTVGEPFFNQMSVPLALSIILLMGLGIAVPWGKADFKILVSVLKWPVVLMVAIPTFFYFRGVHDMPILLTLSFVLFSFSIMFFEMIAVFLKNHHLFSINPKRYGGFIVHIGIIIIAMAVAISKNYQKEEQITFKPEETFNIGTYQLRFEDLIAQNKPYRFEVIAKVGVTENGKSLGALFPKLNFYPSHREPIGSPTVRATPIEDLYLTLMAVDPGNMQITIRAMITPAVSWIWGGSGVILLGALICIGVRKKEEEKEEKLANHSS